VVDQRQIAYYRPIYSINEHAWYRHFNWSPARSQYSAAQPGGAGRVLAAPPARSYAPPHATYVRAAYMRAAYAPRRLSPAARSYAGNASESTASLFAGPNAIR
jgi:hypothetical protein